MNKVELIGRLTKDPEVRYSQGTEPIAVAKFTLAVKRQIKSKKEEEPEADFINCTAFRKTAENIEKYVHKGDRVAVVGHLNVSTYDNNEGKKVWITQVITDELFFLESKKENVQPPASEAKNEFSEYVPEEGDEDLPF